MIHNTDNNYFMNSILNNLDINNCLNHNININHNSNNNHQNAISGSPARFAGPASGVSTGSNRATCAVTPNHPSPRLNSQSRNIGPATERNTLGFSSPTNSDYSNEYPLIQQLSNSLNGKINFKITCPIISSDNRNITMFENFQPIFHKNFHLLPNVPITLLVRR